ncbi:MAG: hypothetical protein GY841_13090 [FCB group bacterium]|nr:hypothetical protein [FCB group bacterium]
MPRWGTISRSIWQHSKGERMSLFKAQDILEDKPTPKIIVLDFFKIPEGEDPPMLEIEISRKTIDVFTESLDNHNNVEISYNGKNPKGKLVSNKIAFCHEVLNASYKDCQGLIDEPSKKAVLALLHQEPLFAKKLAPKLIDAFQNSESYTDDGEEEEKKS